MRFQNIKNLGMMRSSTKRKDDNNKNKEKLKLQINMRKNTYLLHQVLHLVFQVTVVLLIVVVQTT